MPTSSTRKRTAAAPEKKNQESAKDNYNGKSPSNQKKSKRICAAKNKPASKVQAKQKTKKNDKPASLKKVTKQKTTNNDKPTSPQAVQKKTRNASQMTAPTWEEMFYKMVLFQANNQGSTIIPDDETQNKDLAKWAASQRLLYRNATIQGLFLTHEEIQHKKALQQIGFLFEGRTGTKASARNTAHWNERYEQLKEYGRNRGTYNPPKSDPLGVWCHMQRMAYREYKYLLGVFQTKYPNHPIVNPEEIASRRDEQYGLKDIGMAGYISKERIDKLNALDGFIWAYRPSNIPFEERVEQYKEFQRREGHGLVPQHYRENRQLGKWVAKLRCEYKAYREGKKSHLNPERIALLESINFEFCYGDSRGIKTQKQFQKSNQKLCGGDEVGVEEEEEEDDVEEEEEEEKEGV